MKHVVLIILLLASTVVVRAGVAELFTLDKAAIDVEMADLNALEAYVESNPDITFAEVEAINSPLLANVMSAEENPYSVTSMMRRGDPPMGIPSFVWGFCLGWVGIVVVYMVAEDRDETMKALWGCIANGVLSGVFYIIYVALVIGSSTY